MTNVEIKSQTETVHSACSLVVYHVAWIFQEICILNTSPLVLLRPLIFGSESTVPHALVTTKGEFCESGRRKGPEGSVCSLYLSNSPVAGGINTNFTIRRRTREI